MTSHYHALVTAAELLGKDRFATRLGVRLVEAGDVRLVVEMDVHPRHLDRLERVASGVLFSLADCAMSLISNQGRRAVAVATHLTCFGAGPAPATLRAEAVALSPLSGRATTWQVSVMGNGARLTSFVGTTLAVSRG